MQRVWLLVLATVLLMPTTCALAADAMSSTPAQTMAGQKEAGTGMKMDDNMKMEDKKMDDGGMKTGEMQGAMGLKMEGKKMEGKNMGDGGMKMGGKGQQ